MPTYEYECLSCKKTFEIFQQMSDEPLKICPDCSGEVKRLVIGGLGVIFKGQGFYVTDSKKKDSAAAISSSKNPKQQDSTAAGTGQPASAEAKTPATADVSAGGTSCRVES